MADENTTADENATYESPFPSDPVIVVIRKATGSEGAEAAPSADSSAPQPEGASSSFTSIVSAAGGQVTSLFGDIESAPAAPEGSGSGSTGTQAGEGLNLDNFFQITAPLQALANLVEQLLQSSDVEAAYVAPPLQPPIWDLSVLGAPAASAGSTPDFSSHQGYLEAAPDGVDARYAWTQAGGDGSGVQIIDIEGAWQTTHEDLAANQGGVVGGTQLAGLGWVNHGTAVLGEFSGDDNGLGVTGICPGANVRMISHSGNSGASAIKQAADLLNQGDIILLEMHRPGPAANFQLNATQQGYIAVEWWPDMYAAIRYATNKGIIVIEAAGNGAQNLDDPIYNTPAHGFPADWTNPFARGSRDSGAILVGAGSPPENTHGVTWTTDRARLDFSNYGSAVDVQGWGREVTSTGYGDLQGGTDQNKWYTDHFSGTSSASPIVVGAVGCMQGVRRAAGLQPLTPSDVRSLFRSTGSPQQDGTFGPATQRIGNRPDLKQIIPEILSTTFNANDGVTTTQEETAVV
jgi:hypothetical protein